MPTAQKKMVKYAIEIKDVLAMAVETHTNTQVKLERERENTGVFLYVQSKSAVKRNKSAKPKSISSM